MSAVPVPKLSEQLTDLRPELEKVLPAHVSVDKFLRVVNTAISMNPDLYGADRRSLFTSCVKCATDGLLPDGREAALVIFKSKEKYTEGGKQVERWIAKVQYMPMFAGLQKKVRNSGELRDLTCNAVFQHDTFRYWVDDAGEHITHEPNLEADDRGAFKAVYCIVKTKDGGVYMEVMTRGQVEKVRSISKSKDSGPWASWYDEMARKTVFRRLSKRLPMSTDIEQVIRRDDNLYELRQTQAALANANSGVNAAKSLLGITPPAAALDAPSQEDEEPDAAEFDPAAALTRIKEAGDPLLLEQAWSAIFNHFESVDQEIPVDLEAAYHFAKESLAK